MYSGKHGLVSKAHRFQNANVDLTGGNWQK